VETLTFNFAADVPRREQTNLPAKLRSWTEVKAAAKLDPESDDPTVSRMAFVELADEASASSVKTRLAGLKGIDHVESPSTRRLID
jgi:hypothetical protein